MQRILISIAVFVLSAGESRAQAGFQDEFVQLAARVQTFELPFGSGRGLGVDYVVFAGEPINLRVALNNVTRAPVAVSGDWTRHLRLEITPNVPGVAFSIGRTEQPPSATRRVIPSRTSTAADGHLEVPGRPFPPGVYRIDLQIPQGVLLGREGENDGLRTTIILDVREVHSRDDQLNAYYHRAVRARFAGQPNEAVEYLKQLLAMAPDSGAAHYEMGRALAATGDCAGARRVYERAIAAETSGGSADERTRLTGSQLAAFVRRVRANAAACR